MLKVGRLGRWLISSSSEEMEGVMVDREEEEVEVALGAGTSGRGESRDMEPSFLTAAVTPVVVSSLTVMPHLSLRYTAAEGSMHCRPKIATETTF